MVNEFAQDKINTLTTEIPHAYESVGYATVDLAAQEAQTSGLKDDAVRYGVKIEQDNNIVSTPVMSIPDSAAPNAPVKGEASELNIGILVVNIFIWVVVGAVVAWALKGRINKLYQWVRSWAKKDKPTSGQNPPANPNQPTPPAAPQAKAHKQSKARDLLRKALSGLRHIARRHTNLLVLGILLAFLPFAGGWTAGSGVLLVAAAILVIGLTTLIISKIKVERKSVSQKSEVQHTPNLSIWFIAFLLGLLAPMIKAGQMSGWDLNNLMDKTHGTGIFIAIGIAGILICMLLGIVETIIVLSFSVFFFVWRVLAPLSYYKRKGGHAFIYHVRKPYLLVKILNKNSKDIPLGYRLAAASRLLTLGRRDMVEPFFDEFIHILRDSTLASDHESIVDLLGKFGDPRAIEPLSMALGENESIASSIARALQKLSAPRGKVIEAYIVALEASPYYTAMALQKLSGPREKIIKGYFIALGDTQKDIRHSASCALTELGVSEERILIEKWNRGNIDNIADTEVNAALCKFDIEEALNLLILGRGIDQSYGPLLRKLFENKMPVVVMAAQAIPAVEDSINGTSNKAEARNLMVAMGIRLADTAILPCSTLQYGVPLAAVASQGNIEWLEENLKILEETTIDLQPINPFETYKELQPIVKQSTLINNPDDFRIGVHAAKLIPRWRKLAREKEFNTDLTQSAILILLADIVDIAIIKRLTESEICALESGRELVKRISLPEIRQQGAAIGLPSGPLPEIFSEPNIIPAGEITSTDCWGSENLSLATTTAYLYVRIIPAHV